VTPPALNLAPTLVLRPPAAIMRQIAMMAPLAVVEAVAETTGLHAGIKWPNDVQIGGKKVAGILIETIAATDSAEPSTVLVGSGINVNFDPREHDEIRDVATSLRVELGREVEREAVLTSYLAHFERLYDAANDGESPFTRWRERLVTVGQHVHATWPGGTADGLAEDVDTDGALLVRIGQDAVVRVEAGDVTLRG
jgi:BirA family biotin operon repressor/biotin-[acetyl-CoA-carboxylase] ligase